MPQEVRDITEKRVDVGKGQSNQHLKSNGTSGMSCRVRDQLVEQELVYEKLPKDIADRHVLLMDPILATGNSAARAIQASLSTTNKNCLVTAQESCTVLRQNLC